jgi:carbonic anhydrase
VSLADELAANNARYAEHYQGPLPTPPSRQLAVVTCMDSRMDVHALLGLQLGEAHVLRNAGGIVTEDVIRSLVVSQRLLKTEEIVVIHHTQCGLLDLDEASFTADLERDAGSRPLWRPGTFHDVDADVRSCVAQLRNSPYLSHTDRVTGFVFEVETGRLRPVS